LGTLSTDWTAHGTVSGVQSTFANLLTPHPVARPLK
jgi:hypothetical protein